jgi:hypothetical protein
MTHETAFICTWGIVLLTALGFWLTCAVLRRLRERRRRETPQAMPGRWEAVTDSDGAMVRVRWSIPDSEGCYLWVGHYVGTPWGMNAAEREAERFNREGRLPNQCGLRR